MLCNKLLESADAFKMDETRIIRIAVTSYSVMSWLRQLVTSLSSQRTGFDPRQVHVGYMVDKLD
jgi:hypothetical protein